MKPNTKKPKEQAKLLANLIPSKAKNRTSPSTLKYEEKTHSDPVQIANALNDHFITIGHKTSKLIPPPRRRRNQAKAQPSPTLPASPHHDRRNDANNETHQQKQSHRYIQIKPTIMKDLSPFLAPILTAMFNRAIDNQEYPNPLKLTKVIELYKSGDKTDPANYRPISLLPIIAKLLDTLINNQIMQHLTKHNIISPTQYAFRPNSSTTLALQTIIDNIHQHTSRRHPTLAIYIDLSKAYDTVEHKKLLDKLQHDFNFAPSTVQFFKSYFQNRMQTTHTQFAQSQLRTITHGIPQGSTLSTTFFLLYINDIAQTTPEAPVYTYADDTTLIITASDTSTMQAKAQNALHKLIQYFHRNNLVPNASKTLFSVFSPPNPTPKSISPSKNNDSNRPLQQNCWES